MNMYLSLGGLVSALLYLLLGLIAFTVAFRYIGRSVVAAFREEIIDKQNMALAVLVGLASLGVSIIIAAAVH